MRNSECRIAAVGLTVVSVSILLHSPFAHAASTISAVETNGVSYGANIGWMHWRADGTNGVAVGEFVFAGSIYGANIGWISVGDGTPANGIDYANDSAADFGVNCINDGELRGCAYGANIGWIVFTNATAAGALPADQVPKFDLLTGKFRGYAYSANCGWIALANQFARVKTDSVQAAADSDGDGIADAWELEAAGDLSTLGGAGHDQDGDGKSDVGEYLADTHPLDPDDYLRIVSLSPNGDGSITMLTWTSNPRRVYQMQQSDTLLAGSWNDVDPPGKIPGDPVGSTTTDYAAGTPSTKRFFRVQAFKPLAP